MKKLSFKTLSYLVYAVYILPGFLKIPEIVVSCPRVKVLEDIFYFDPDLCEDQVDISL
jgi:hypothetical protein